jgi:two-component system cell cycle sensor histidine kinase/response regulator CckA
LSYTLSDIQNSENPEASESLLESRYSQVQHLQAIGTLAGGIAHDFNNILFGIQGYAELALAEAPEGSIQADNLNEILNGCHRAKELVHQILTFSRQDNGQKIPVSLPPLIKEALKLLRAGIPSSIDIQTRFAPDLPRVDAKPGRIQRIIMNLCTNAAQAIGNAPGTIRIILDLAKLTPIHKPAKSTLPYGDYVRLVVQDDGEGIPQEWLGRIFEPFFTTKDQGQGSGMGLSVVHGIVLAHQGEITVQSQPGHGTRFEVLLPALAKEEPPVETAWKLPANGSGRIMYVDDEMALGLMMERMLTGLGYKATVHNDPAKALAQFQSQPDAFDLVITDLTMPRMTGLILCENLLRIRSEVPVLLCTGYGDQIDKDQCRRLGFRDLIHKPMTKQELAATIHDALHHPNQRVA